VSDLERGLEFLTDRSPLSHGARRGDGNRRQRRWSDL